MHEFVEEHINIGEEHDIDSDTWCDLLDGGAFHGGALA